MSQKEPTIDLGSTPTAKQVAEYLKAHPDFFDKSPGLLSEINVPHPQSGQAISLVERQASVLRERIKSMELKLAELLRNGQENDAISASIQHWVRGLFYTRIRDHCLYFSRTHWPKSFLSQWSQSRSGARRTLIATRPGRARRQPTMWSRSMACACRSAEQPTSPQPFAFWPSQAEMRNQLQYYPFG